MKSLLQTRFRAARNAIIGMIRHLRRRIFPGSRAYWERRYRKGGTSGHGSYGEHARYKADFLNRFVRVNSVRTVVEFGCGDGNQLSLADYPYYVGLDVSITALSLCEQRFAGDPSKAFFEYKPDHFTAEQIGGPFDIALSLDVVFHLVENDVYEQHIRHLFESAKRFVVVFSTDADDGSNGEGPDVRAVIPAAHVRHRFVSRDIEQWAPDWELLGRERAPGETVNDMLAKQFLIYSRK